MNIHTKNYLQGELQKIELRIKHYEAVAAETNCQHSYQAAQKKIEQLGVVRADLQEILTKD